jgi:hypothetical protein
MGFLKPNPPRIKVEVMQSTHGQTYVTWPTNVVVADGESLPPLPVGQNHARSRHWVLADRTAVLILPGDPQEYQGGVVRHVFDVEAATWNRRTKTLASLVRHPDDPDVTFAITTSGVGCSCTQGAAGNAGPIGEPYEIAMINPTSDEFGWFTVVPAP